MPCARTGTFCSDTNAFRTSIEYSAIDEVQTKYLVHTIFCLNFWSNPSRLASVARVLQQEPQTFSETVRMIDNLRVCALC